MSLNNQTISIVIPCFNSEKTIESCLCSVINQTYKHWEAICIDDGSYDRTYSILQKLSALDSRIKVVHGYNQGAAKARELGYSLATGQFVTFVDSDDTIDVFFLSEMLSAFTPDVDIVVSGVNRVRQNKKKPIRKSSTLRFTQIEFMKRVLTGKFGWELWGKLYRARLFKETLFTPESIAVGEDAIHFIQLLSRSKNIKLIKSCGYNYVQHSGSISKIQSKKLAHDTLLAAGYIEKILRKQCYYQKIQKEIDSMYLLFYCNATRRSKIGWFDDLVLEIYREHLTFNSLIRIPKIKSVYVLFFLFLANINAKLRCCCEKLKI